MALFETLQERLTALQESTSQLRELIDRLANIKFQPGSVPLPASMSSSVGSLGSSGGGEETSNVATELSAEISQMLREEEEELELLREEVTDLRSGRPGSETEHRRTRLKEGVQRLQAEFKRFVFLHLAYLFANKRSCRTAFRKAQLSARRSLAEAQKLERDLLLASLTALKPAPPAAEAQPQTQQGQAQHTELFSPRDRRRLAAKAKSQSSNLVTASSDVTEALRRTHALISGEVAKSAFAAQTLAESTAALKELQQNYEGIDGLLARSRELVGALLTSQKSDTWYLRTSFYVLLATLAWLVFRRFLYGPLWWVVWLPVRTTFRTGKAVTNTLAGQSGARMEVGDPEGGKARVVGVGKEGAVPTVRVDGAGDAKPESDDSMVDTVAKIVEDSLKGKVDEFLNETEHADQPNPMKRMWEEDDQGQAVVEDDRPRDEL